MKKLWIALGCCFFSRGLVAHPHSFLDIQNKVLIHDGQLTGFAMDWQLDEITSAELIYEIQSAKDKTAAEQKITSELNRSAVDNHYFSELYDRQKQPIKFKAHPVNPKIDIQHGRLRYHFELALAKPQPVAGQTFTLLTFEPSYYLYMGYEKPSDLSSSPQDHCQVSLEEPTVNQSLRLYASKLDKTESPDEMAVGSLGEQFAQRVKIVCR